THGDGDVGARLFAAVRLTGDEEVRQHEEGTRTHVGYPAIDRLVQIRDDEGRLGDPAHRLPVAELACHEPLPRAALRDVCVMARESRGQSQSFAKTGSIKPVTGSLQISPNRLYVMADMGRLWII